MQTTALPPRRRTRAPSGTQSALADPPAPRPPRVAVLRLDRIAHPTVIAVFDVKLGDHLTLRECKLVRDASCGWLVKFPYRSEREEARRKFYPLIGLSKPWTEAVKAAAVTAYERAEQPAGGAQ